MSKTLEEENKILKEELKKRSDDYREIEKMLIDICQLTFSKYHQNEWANCLSYMDDISPIVDKMRELEGKWNMFYNEYKEKYMLFLRKLEELQTLNKQKEGIEVNDRRNDC